MGAKVVFMRRIPKEIEIFGGDVFIDIDGKNVGKLGLTDFVVQLENGKHRFKMYKSHTYDTYIGFAETEIDIISGSDLLIKYSPPMLVNQPGNLMVSDFKSNSQVDAIADEKKHKLNDDYNFAEQKKAELEEKNKNGVTIFITIIIVTVVIYIILMANLENNLHDILSKFPAVY